MELERQNDGAWYAKQSSPTSKLPPQMTTISAESVVSHEEFTGEGMQLSWTIVEN